MGGLSGSAQVGSLGRPSPTEHTCVRKHVGYACMYIHSLCVHIYIYVKTDMCIHMHRVGEMDMHHLEHDDSGEEYTTNTVKVQNV